MFRIRKIHDNQLPLNKEALRQVMEILQDRFPEIHISDVEKIPEMLENPLKYRFRSILYIAENNRGILKGFALLSHEPQLKFCYLDYISSTKDLAGSGFGGILYERVREEALMLNVAGIFLECLPDDPRLSPEPVIRKQNRARLRFYERYGARPIAGTAYETPLEPGDDNPPYLIFDDLGQGSPLRVRTARVIVRAILERKYGDLCPPGYIEMVVKSFHDNPVRLRDFRYVRRAVEPVYPCGGRVTKIAMVINDRHAIHHVRERGYVESPVRISAIVDELDKTDLFEKITPSRFSEKHIKAVHDPGYVEYFKKVCNHMDPGKSLYPYVFPIRNIARPPKELAVRAGYYCIDTFTPLNENAYLAAKRAADCTLSAARTLLKGHRAAYSLIRPPGHHAEQHSFGGFCYFNNAAIAANYLSSFGRIAMLDIDYHHGNGQQQIFYERSDVLTVSVHGHPSFAYPYFSGFEDERGNGPGEGFNRNYPLKERIFPSEHFHACEQALKKVREFAPLYLIVCFGLDTAKGDPTGTWALVAQDFERLGRLIGSRGYPTLVVQEGGYRTRTIGINARHFFTGFCAGMYGQLRGKTGIKSRAKGK